MGCIANVRRKSLSCVLIAMPIFIMIPMVVSTRLADIVITRAARKLMAPISNTLGIRAIDSRRIMSSGKMWLIRDCQMARCVQVAGLKKARNIVLLTIPTWNITQAQTLNGLDIKWHLVLEETAYFYQYRT